MLTFNDIPTAYVDAESEADFAPQNIKTGFYDFKDSYSALTKMSSPKCFISGRKGTGKSAFIYRINILNDSCVLKLESLPYKELKKNSDPKLKDHLKYSSIWKLLLLNFSIRNIDTSLIKSGNEQFNEIKHLLTVFGLDGSTENTVKTATKRKMHWKIFDQELSYESDFEKVPTSIFELINELYSMFKKISFKKAFYLLIDGVDDVLLDQDKNNSLSEILSSLITNIYMLNLDSKRDNNNFKIIMAVRSDIWGKINGPDINKRALTNKINLEWISDGEQKELAKLLNKRLSVQSKISDFVSNNQHDVFALWKNFFPQVMYLKHNRETSSWKYFLEYSLYRPRDIIQFLTMAKENYPNKSHLNSGQFNGLVNQFSKEYFFDEMRNEMVGFVDPNVLNYLTKALQNLGRDGFKFNDFLQAFHKINPDLKDESIKSLLEQLFDHGYIGQRSSEHEKYNFKHKDSHVSIEYTNSLVIHRGLYAAVALNK